MNVFMQTHSRAVYLWNRIDYREEVGFFQSWRASFVLRELYLSVKHEPAKWPSEQGADVIVLTARSPPQPISP